METILIGKKAKRQLHLDEERMFMYDCHPQLSHQLPFDPGVPNKDLPQVQWFMYQNQSESSSSILHR